MTDSPDFGAEYARAQIGRSRHPLRRRVKRLFLANLLRQVHGPTVDLGCGAGQLLELLPEGSLGLELNPFLIDALAKRGLNVARYDALSDDFALTPVASGRFRTLVMAHVLEHFEDAAAALGKLLAACARLGIERVVVVVPGERGFRSDPTHRTFVNGAYLQRHGLLEAEGWTLAARYGFPLNVEWLGGLFVYHELTLVYERGPVQR